MENITQDMIAVAVGSVILVGSTALKNLLEYLTINDLLPVIVQQLTDIMASPKFHNLSLNEQEFLKQILHLMSNYHPSLCYSEILDSVIKILQSNFDCYKVAYETLENVKVHENWVFYNIPSPWALTLQMHQLQLIHYYLLFITKTLLI